MATNEQVRSSNFRGRMMDWTDEVGFLLWAGDLCVLTYRRSLYVALPSSFPRLGAAKPARVSWIETSRGQDGGPTPINPPINQKVSSRQRAALRHFPGSPHRPRVCVRLKARAQAQSNNDVGINIHETCARRLQRLVEPGIDDL